MAGTFDPRDQGSKDTAPLTPRGGVPLSRERLEELAAAWEALSRSLRRMDELNLGETEPRARFVWRAEE